MVFELLAELFHVLGDFGEFVGVCVFDGGVVVGVECERVVLDVFKGGGCVQGDADAVFVEVFETKDRACNPWGGWGS